MKNIKLDPIKIIFFLLTSIFVFNSNRIIEGLY